LHALTVLIEDRKELFFEILQRFFDGFFIGKPDVTEFRKYNAKKIIKEPDNLPRGRACRYILMEFQELFDK
jgi:hypothetical protein